MNHQDYQVVQQALTGCQKARGQLALFLLERLRPIAVAKVREARRWGVCEDADDLIDEFWLELFGQRRSADGQYTKCVPLLQEWLENLSTPLERFLTSRLFRTCERLIKREQRRVGKERDVTWQYQVARSDREDYVFQEQYEMRMEAVRRAIQELKERLRNDPIRRIVLECQEQGLTPAETREELRKRGINRARETINNLRSKNYRDLREILLKRYPEIVEIYGVDGYQPHHTDKVEVRIRG